MYKGRTVSLCCSPIFLPASLLSQSPPAELLPSLDMMPGTTRGISSVREVVVKSRVSRRMVEIVIMWAERRVWVREVVQYLCDGASGFLECCWAVKAATLLTREGDVNRW